MITLDEIIANPEFQKLRQIGGHKTYHLEGDAYEHTMRVILEARVLFNDDPFMLNVAALHDIGKIYTSICHGEGDWEYPDHAKCGSFRGILSKFVPESDPDFKRYQWYIENHIKPLFWRQYGLDYAKFTRNKPEGCSVINLIELAICDIRGSVSVEPQDDLIRFLYATEAEIRDRGYE